MKKDSKNLYGYTKQDIIIPINGGLDIDKYTKINDNTEEYYDILADEKKKKIRKKSKNHIFTFLIIILVILGIGGLGSYAYVKFYFTAERFLDNSVQNFNNWLTETFTISNSESDVFEFDLAKDSWQLKGNIGFTSNVATYEEFANLDFNFNAYSNINKSLEYLTLDILNNETSIFNGEIYIDKTIGYFNIPSIYPSAIYSTMAEDPFLDMQNSEEYIGMVMNFQSYFDIATKYINFVATALKESEITTTNKGLTVLYEYVINDSNKENVNTKLNSLVAEDPLLSAYMKNNIGEDWQNINTLSNMNISFEVNVITGKIVTFNVTTKDNTYNGEVINDNKFRITDNSGEYLDIDTYKNRLNITLNSNGTTTEQINIECNDNVITIKYIDAEYKLELSLAEEDSTSKFNLVMESDGVSVTFNNASTISTENITYNGNIILDMDGTNIGLEYDASINMGIDVPIKLYENAKSVDDLTEDDYNLISNNLNTFISSIPDSPLYQIISLFLVSDEEETNSESHI